MDGWDKTKYVRKLTGISVLFVLVFMALALMQYKQEEGSPLLPNQFELFYNENWTMTWLGTDAAEKADFLDGEKMLELFTGALETKKRENVSLPYVNEGKTGKMVILHNSIPEDYAGLTMRFDSADAFVHMYLDGEAIYNYGVKEAKDYGKVPGSMENLVSLPNSYEKGELFIALEPIYSDSSVGMGEMKLESRDMVVISVVLGNISDIGCCLLIVIMAIILFVLAMIRKYTNQPARGELFLALAELMAGIYYFINTDTLNVFYNVREAYEMQEYLILLFLMFMTLYFDRNLRSVYPKRFSALLWFVCFNAVAQILLHQSNIRALEDMQAVSDLAVCVICVVSVISLLQLGRKNYMALLSVVSMLVLVCGEAANYILYVAFDGAYGNTANQYSMAVFVIIMATMHTLQLSKEYRANAEENAQLLQEKVNVAEKQNVQLALAKEDADAARYEALAANEAKGKFLAHMSHEIRTPINAVLGMDEMILRESTEPNIKDYAMDIYTAGQTLLSLINDILDFSKIESGKMEIVPTEYDVSSMIHDLANMASQRAKDKNIRLEVEASHEIPSRLYGDDVRIRQALTNLLTNAVKYTHEGTVWMRIQCSKNGDMAKLSFEVEDTGIGIKKEDLPKLSAEFERIEEERNRNIEGTGLGMNITIQLLTLLGSKLHVESVYGKGSKFSFDLEQKIVDETPIGDFESRVHQLAEHYSYSTRFYAPDAKILVVDDNAVNRKVLRSLLKETQIQVTDAGGGVECLELAQKEHFDLIFLDHMMPEMDGVETLHRMKELSDYPCKDTPVVVLTANAVSGAKEKYLAEGFDDFLSKPIVLEKLENMIKSMLPENLLKEAVSKEPSGGGQGEGLILAGASRLDLKENENKENEDKENKDKEKGDKKAKESVHDFLESLPQVDGLDWQYAWMHLPDQELLEFTVKEFYEQIDSAAKQLELYYGQIVNMAQPFNTAFNPPLNQTFAKTDKKPSGDITAPLEQYRIQVHAMKSLAATVGILPLSGVAKILEYAARDFNTDYVLSITPAFLEEWRGYSQKLQGAFGIGAQEKKEVTDYSVMRALVEMLRLSMQEMDIDQADQLIGKLREYEYPQEIEQNIKKLAEAVTNLDAEQTESLAGELIRQMEQEEAG